MLSELTDLLGADRVITDDSVLKKISQNTLGIDRDIPSVIFPKTLYELQTIITLANEYNSPIHPISTGKNIGYGDMIPPANGQILVNMHDFNDIPISANKNIYQTSELEREGFIHIGIGVTQKELFDYISKQNNSSSKNKWFMDVTGSGLYSGVGTVQLIGGFGHTPYGNRRKQISGIEAILGNGEQFYGGVFPGTGPDLNSLFVQSNIGVATSIRISLMRLPEVIETYLITIPERDGLEELFNSLTVLRQNGTLNSLIHVADPVRLLVTQGIPQNYKDIPYFSSDRASDVVSESVSRIPFMKKRIFWTVLGGLYGSKKEVKAKRDLLKESMAALHADTFFFTNEKIDQYSKIASILGRVSDTGKYIQGYMQSLKGLGAWTQGIPTNLAENNIGWRVKNFNDLGLIWISPTFGTDSKTAKYVYDTAESVLNQYGFDAPLTMTFVEPDRVVGILNIHFDKRDAIQKRNAYQAYIDLHKEYASNHIYPYRQSILGMELNLECMHDSNKGVLRSLKKTYDPNNIISPGLYGI